MKKVKYLLVLILISFIGINVDAKAIHVTTTSYTPVSLGAYYLISGDEYRALGSRGNLGTQTKNGTRFYKYDFTLWYIKGVTSAGSSVDLYCVDPGNSGSPGLALTCQPYQDDAVLTYLFNNGDRSNKSAFTMAIRLYGMYKGLNKGFFDGQRGMFEKAAFIRTAQQEIGGMNLGTEGYKRLYGDVIDKAISIIKNAQNAVGDVVAANNKAIEEAKKKSSSSSSSNSLSASSSGWILDSNGNLQDPGITITQSETQGDYIGYVVQSGINIDASHISITCDGCEDLIVGTWDGTKAGVFAKPKDDKNSDCSFTILVNYIDGSNKNGGIGENGNGNGNNDDNSKDNDNNSSEETANCTPYKCSSGTSKSQDYLACLTDKQIIKAGSSTGKTCLYGKDSNGNCLSLNPSVSSGDEGTVVTPTIKDDTLLASYTSTGCKPDCCTEDVVDFAKIPQGSINNCCDTTDSYIDEYPLNKLFCNDKTLNVDYYKLKCGAEIYENTDVTLNDYCVMYCTEKVSYTLPGPTSTKSGRYFKLQTHTSYTGASVSGPSMKGEKRCRIITSFDKWYTDYLDKVNSEINGYNENQKQLALYNEYKDAVDSATSVDVKFKTTINYQWTGTCTGTRPDGKGGEESYDYPCPESDSCDVTTTASVKKYPIAGKYWYNVLTVKNDSSFTNYDKIEITKKDYLNVKSTQSLQDYYVYNLDTAKSDAAGKVTSCVPAGKTETSRNTSCDDGEICNRNMNVEAARDAASAAATSANATYNNAADRAKSLETQLTYCQTFIDKSKTDSSLFSSVYDFDPEMSFNYTQAYVSDAGNTISGKVPIDFTKNCVRNVQRKSEVSESADGDGIDANRYSTKYSITSNNIFTKDFKNTTLQLDGNGAFTGNLDTDYTETKAFTNDGLYTVICDWDDTQVNTFTLVPSGVTTGGDEGSIKDITSNYTIHDKVYKVFTTQYSGKYETEFNLSNVGSDGKFDSIISQKSSDYSSFYNNKTCSGDYGNATCYFENISTITIIGDCNNPGVFDVSAVQQYCPTCKNGKCDNNCTGGDCTIKNGFDYKTVDPGNLFPSGTTTSDGKEYAINWTKTDEGQKAQANLKNLSDNTNVYSPDNLTYSFTLTSSDIKAIKAYNSSRVSFGGFTDFDLNCSLSNNTRVRCISPFLDAISGGGSLTYDGGELSLSTWNGSKTLNEVRNSQQW